ncbi:MAG: hypothetical protein NTX64_17055 [Elusimicrobia bacterium]|nr:hypothetical protein [Elusimicrobiota bacterium]
MIARLLRGRGRGQATTEVVLLVPLFMLFLFLFAKVFALLVLVQKMEIASYYAARRWQLESHRNVFYEASDAGGLLFDIKRGVNEYLGTGTRNGRYLDLEGNADVKVTRTQVWNIVTLTVRTKPLSSPVFKYLSMKNRGGFTFSVTKYVPNRDRPIAFQLPGVASGP